MRREDDEVLEALRDALDESGDAARREVAAMHRIETWRERLLDQGDAALAELLDEYPTADRQQLRQLVRSALDERKRNKPPRAYRELYRALREMLLGGAAAGADDVADERDDDALDEGQD
jgi:ribosome-associated protein